MAQIEFVDCVLKSFTRRPKGGVAKFQAKYSNPVARAMEWTDEEGDPIEPAKFYHGMSLDGDLAATVITMQSEKGTKLADFMFEIKAQSAKAFKAVRREEKGTRGKGKRWELAFEVHFVDLTGCRHLEEYMISTGEYAGTLTVRYEPVAKQQTLPDVGDDKKASDDPHKKQVDEIIEKSKRKQAPAN